MKKITKRIVSTMLAASMMFTAVTANPTFAFAASDSVTAYEAFSGTATLDMAEVNAAHPEWYGATLAGDYLGSGFTVVLKEGQSNDFKGAWNTKDGTPGVFSDGTSCAERYQMGKGNEVIPEADVVEGATVAFPEKALKLEAAAAGTVTFYADAGSTGITGYILAMTDSSNVVLQAKTKTKGTLEPTVFNIPAEGTYYFFVPGKATSLNIGAIKVALEGGSAETTTEITTEITTEAITEAITEATTEAPSGTVMIDMAEVNAAHPEWAGSTINGDYLGGGISVVTAGSGFDFKGAWNSKDGTPGVFSDGTSCAERLQMGKGNKAIAADITAGETAGTVEKALQLDAAGAGTVTLYADAGSTIGSVFDGNYKIILVDAATGKVVQAEDKVKDGNLIPTVLNIPAAGTYYMLVPGNLTSLNIGAIKVALEDGSAETTTEITTESTTEAITEATTEAPVGKEDSILVQAAAPAAVVQDGHNVVDRAANKTFNVNIDLSQVDSFAAANDGNGINNYTFFVKYNPEVVKMTGVATVNEKDVDEYVHYETEDYSGGVKKCLVYDSAAIANNIALVPGSDDVDYADVTTSGAANTFTCAELGKVKLSNCIYAQNADKSLKTAKNNGTLVTLTFEVVGTGDTELTVDFSSDRVDGFCSNPTSAKKPAVEELAANIWIGDVKEETTTETSSETTTETTTEATTETSSETTTETTSEVTTETSSEATTETSSEVTTGTIELDAVIADVNMDGKITADDAAFLLQRVLMLEFVLPCAEAYPDKYYYIADVNADGILTADDSAYILQKTLDFSFEFPIEQVIKGEKQYDYPVNQK